MSLSNFPTGPDSKPSYTALIEALEKVNALSNLTGEQFSPITINWNGIGFVVQDNTIPGRWIKITSGTQPYAWTAQVDDGSGTLSDDSDTGSSGTTTAIPAYEINGKANVVANSIVWAWPAIDGLSMLFDLFTLTSSPQTWPATQTFTSNVTVTNNSNTVTFSNPTTIFANPITHAVQVSSPSTPSAGYSKVYVDSQGMIHTKSASGAVCCYPCVPTNSLLDSSVLVHMPFDTQAITNFGSIGNPSENLQASTTTSYVTGLDTSDYALKHTDTGDGGNQGGRLDWTPSAGNWDLASTDEFLWMGTVRFDNANVAFDGFNYSSISSGTFKLSMAAGGSLVLHYGSAQTVTSSVTLAINTSYWIAAYRQESTDKIYLYVNGTTDENTGASSSIAVSPDGSVVYMCSDTGNPAVAYTATWDGVIFRKGASVAPTAAQLANWYNSGKGNASPGCTQIPQSWISQSSVTQWNTALNHATLLNLAWTSSGHTGTATRLFGTSGAGAAAEYTITGTGTVIAAQTAAALTSPVLTTPTVTTSILPTNDDGAPLGSTSKQWSDLFLATGGVINWGGGEVTITAGTDTITVAGATLITAGTACAVACGTIELGHASDTTLARSAAGILTVEGVPVASLIAVVNGSGATANANEIGYINSSGQYATTTTSGDDKSWCVVVVGAANGSTIYVQNRGLATIKCTAANTAGDWLITSTTAAQAATNGTSPHYAMFAKVITASGGAGQTCTALLYCMTKPVAKTYEFPVKQNLAHSTSRFEALINGAPTATVVVYDTISAGAENLLTTSFGASELGRLLLWNSTRSTGRLVVDVVLGTNTITTVSSSDAWADNDAITLESVNVVSGTTQKVIEVDLSQQSIIPTTARILHVSIIIVDTAASMNEYLHPIETYANSKAQPVFRTQVANVALDMAYGEVQLIGRRFGWASTANGAGTKQTYMNLTGWDEAVP